MAARCRQRRRAAPAAGPGAARHPAECRHRRHPSLAGRDGARHVRARYVAAVASWQPNAFRSSEPQIKPDCERRQSGVRHRRSRVHLGRRNLRSSSPCGTQRSDRHPRRDLSDATVRSRFRRIRAPAAPATRWCWRSGASALSGFQDTRCSSQRSAARTLRALRTQFAFRLFRMGPNDTCETILGDRIQDNFRRAGQADRHAGADDVTRAATARPWRAAATRASSTTSTASRSPSSTGGPPMFKWSQFNGGLVGTGLFDAASHRQLTIMGNKSAITTSGLTDCYLEAFDFDPQRGRWSSSTRRRRRSATTTSSRCRRRPLAAIPGGNSASVFSGCGTACARSPISRRPPSLPNELRDGIRPAVRRCHRRAQLHSRRLLDVRGARRRHR